LLKKPIKIGVLTLGNRVDGTTISRYRDSFFITKSIWNVYDISLGIAFRSLYKFAILNNDSRCIES